MGYAKCISGGGVVEKIVPCWRRVMFELSPDLLNLLDQYARHHKLTRTYVVRRAIDTYLARQLGAASG